MYDTFPILTALLFGALSFLSPCVLPLVPAYLSYLAGDKAKFLSIYSTVDSDDISKEKAVQAKNSLIISSLAFISGFSAVFIALGATATSLGQALLININWLAQIAGVIIFIAGLHYIGILRIGFLMRIARFEGPQKTTGILGGFLLGVSFGFAWTPCIGPILGTILAIAAQGDTVWYGVLLLGFYSLGLATPFFLCALFVDRISAKLGFFKRHFRKIEIATGILLSLTGLLMISGDFVIISGWLLDNFPSLQKLG